MDNGFDAMLIADDDGICVRANPVSAKLLGYAPDELVGRRTWEIVADDDAAAGAAWWRAHRAAPTHSTKHMLRRRDGTLVEVMCRVVSDVAPGLHLSTFRDVTEQRRAEQQLGQSWEFLRATLDGLAEQLAILDAQGCIVVVNAAWRAFARDNGWTSDTCGVGDNYVSVCRAGAQEGSPGAGDVAAGLDAVLTGKRASFTIEYPCDCPAPHQERWFQMRSSAFEHGGTRWVVVTHSDVTDRRRAGDALRASQERYARATHAAMTGVWEWELATGQMHLDPIIKTLLGYSTDEFADRIDVWSQHVHPDDRQKVAAATKAYLRGFDDEYVVEQRMLTKDGTTRWFILRGAAVRDVKGEPLWLVGTSTDITDLKRVEAELRESRRLVQQISDMSPAMMYIYDLEQRRAVYANRGCAEFLGVAHDALDNLSWDFIAAQFHPDDALTAGEHAAQYADLDDGAVLKTELRMRNAQGAWRWIEFRELVFARDKEGRPRRIVGMALDVTDRRQAEQELRRYREHLEELVEQRSRELEQSREQLRQSERLASLGTLAAGVAHEINNPLSTIRISAQCALQGRDRAELFEESLDDIVSETDRCSRIVKSVLQFARQQPAERWEIDFRDVAWRSADLAEDYATRHGITLQTELPDEAVSVLGNPIELQQVCINLIHNAVHASQRGTGVVVGVTADPRPTLRVSDRGCGMTHTVRARVFDPFFTTRGTEGGTGLGLSIVHGIVNAHGGDIVIRSTPGCGTTMLVQLPALSSSPITT